MQRNVNKANINIDLVFISQMVLLTHCAPAAAAAAAASYYKFHSQKHTAKNKHRVGRAEGRGDRTQCERAAGDVKVR